MRENQLLSAEILMLKKITELGQTGTESQQANEEYRKHGMTKIDEESK
jgi:hypothetical protein